MIVTICVTHTHTHTHTHTLSTRYEDLAALGEDDMTVVADTLLRGIQDGTVEYTVNVTHATMC